MARRSDIDWDAIEREYRLGQKSNKQIAMEFGIQPSTLGRRAEKYEWVQDKSKEVHTRAANMLLLEDVANATGKNATRNANANATPSTADIKIAARARVDVILGHRKLSKRAMDLAKVMLGDLEVSSSPEGAGLIESLLDAVAAPAEGEIEDEQKRRRQKQRDLLEKALGLDSRVDTLKRLSETIDRLVNMERQAFGITDKSPAGESPLDGSKSLTTAERASRVSSLLALAEERRQDARSSPMPPGPSAPSAFSEAKADAA